jgi:hypothetical protein
MKRILGRTLIALILLVAIGLAHLWSRNAWWPKLFPLAVVAMVAWTVLGPLLLDGRNLGLGGSESPGFWRPTPDGYFMEHRRPGWKRGSQKKLCFFATDQALLADVLQELAARPDCQYVKYSLYQKGGVYLGRCFLVDDQQVGLLWAKYKEHPRLFCTVQDDDFTLPFRPA